MCKTIVAIALLVALTSCASLQHKVELACERQVLEAESCKALADGRAIVLEALQIYNAHKHEPMPTRLRAIEHLIPQLQKAEQSALALYEKHKDSMSQVDRAKVIGLQVALDKAKDFSEIADALLLITETIMEK